MSVCTPVRDPGVEIENGTWASSSFADDLKAAVTAAVSPAEATEPPPAAANPRSAVRASGSLVLNCTTSTRTPALLRAVVTESLDAALFSAMVSAPSLSSTMLRSPSAPRAPRALCTPAYRLVSPRETSPSTTCCAAARSVVGPRSTPGRVGEGRDADEHVRGHVVQVLRGRRTDRGHARCAHRAAGVDNEHRAPLPRGGLGDPDRHVLAVDAGFERVRVHLDGRLASDGEHPAHRGAVPLDVAHGDGWRVGGVRDVGVGRE